MIKAILNNPYRILGVYSNSPKKEQVANKGKMQAFLRVKKSMPFKLDLQGILPEVKRTQELVDYADSELALSSGQIKHAQFWFINKTPIDGIAFNHLTSGNIDTAIDFWKKSINLYSLQNLFVCYLIKEDYVVAVNTAVLLYNQYSKEFISEIDAKATVSLNTLIQTVVDTISNDGVDLFHVSKGISDNTWKTTIEAKKVEPLISQLNTHVSDAKATKGKGASARLIAGNKLKKATSPLMATLHRVIPLNDTRYQMIADKIAQEVLQCCVDYYKETDDVDSPAKALPLCEYAMAVVVGNLAKQRCERNYKVIKEAYDNMPPTVVAVESKEINELLNWYTKQEKTSKNGLELLKKAKKPLIAIKEKVGKNHAYYLETSSIIGNAALSYVIDEVNDAQKEDKPDPFEGLFGSSSIYNLYGDIFGGQERRRQKALRIKSALHDAWQTIIHIDLLDKTDEFNKNRFQPNRKTLHSIIDGLKGFDYPDDQYIIKGCAHGLTVDKKFFWSDSEHYDACSTKSDYNKYLELFPSGAHVEEAKKKLVEIKEHERKIRKYVLIALAIATILFVILIAANGKGNGSANNRTAPVHKSGYYENPRSLTSSEESLYEDNEDEEDVEDDQDDEYSSDEDYDSDVDDFVNDDDNDSDGYGDDNDSEDDYDNDF